MILDLITNLKSELRKAIIKAGFNFDNIDIVIEIPKERHHGDYATNVAMRLAKNAKMAPIQIANKICDNLDKKACFLSKTEPAMPGFINFILDETFLTSIVLEVLRQGHQYGCTNIGQNKRVNLEFVSANPTGYLHIGHGRGASYGDSLANLLTKIGYDVTREHYVNDAGNQITNMAYSVYERYKELFGLPIEFKEDYYRGKEIIVIAEKIKELYRDKYVNQFDLDFFRNFGTAELLNNLKNDLNLFNVHFDVWFSEKSLYEQNIVQDTLQSLIDKGFTYELDGALWLKTTIFGDDKDRVLVKSDGTYTYVVPDIGYHANKLSRGYSYLINVLGSDHHGYVPRLKSAVNMIGGNANLIDVEIHQMVRILENGEEIKMSKRSGKAITLIDLIEEVGTDVLRYFYVSKALGTHMDLDIDLMRKKSNENPVFYAQYAHARIASLFRTFEKNGDSFVVQTSFEHIDGVKIKDLCLTLLEYPRIIEEAATKRLVHKVTNYIDELSYCLHSLYNDEKIITDNKQETLEKLTVLKAVQIVLKDALSIIGIKAMEQM